MKCPFVSCGLFLVVMKCWVRGLLPRYEVFGSSVLILQLQGFCFLNPLFISSKEMVFSHTGATSIYLHISCGFHLRSALSIVCINLFGSESHLKRVRRIDGRSRYPFKERHFKRTKIISSEQYRFSGLYMVCEVFWFPRRFHISLQLLCFMQLGFIVPDRPCWRNRVWLFEHFIARGLLSFLFLFDILHCFICFTIFLFLFCNFWVELHIAYFEVDRYLQVKDECFLGV